MKKSSVIKISAAAILILFILLVVSTFRYQSIPVPTFNFLGGRALTTRTERNQSVISQTRFIYSFEADFNDIVADADSELAALGYINSSIPKANPPHIVYYLHGKKPISLISVTIIKNHKMNVISTPGNSDYKTPVQYVRNWKNGWVTVEIEQSKQKNRLIVMYQNLLNKFYEPDE